MEKERTHYDRSFKEHVVKLSYERKHISELARELGIRSNLIYRWRKELEEYGNSSFPGNGIQKLTQEEKDLVILKEKMRKLELENEILKKAVHIFSRDNQ